MTEPAPNERLDGRRTRRRRRRTTQPDATNENTNPAVGQRPTTLSEGSRSRGGPKGREGKNGAKDSAARRSDETGSSNGVRPRFAPYWTEDTATMKLHLGQCFCGTLRINAKGSCEGYISLPSFPMDIMIRPGNFQNRAFGGDEVIYRILPTPFWWTEKSIPPRNDVQGVPFPTEGDMGFLDNLGRRMGILRKEIHIALQLRKRGQMERLQLPVVWDFAESPEEAKTLIKEVMLYFPELRPTAEIVHIAKSSSAREALVGVLRCDPKIPQLVYLFPLNPALPKRFIVSSESVGMNCMGLLAEASSEESTYRTLVKANLLRWEVHEELPTVTITEVIGRTDTIEKQTLAILSSWRIDHSAFTQDVLDCLPEEDWTLTADDFDGRMDLRDTCVFSIDPPTARDLDDALSIEKLSDDRFRVGVHIADVSYFVKPGTALDRVALERTTSVYLVQRVIPMLPERLSANLCSLNPGKDRLTFSIVWEMNGQGEIFTQHVQKSVIHSAAKMAYHHAQSAIDDPSTFQPENLKIHGGYSWDKVKDDIVMLFQISRHLRRKRFEDGALKLNRTKIHFSLNDQGLPETAEPTVLKEANSLIEEFMLLANMSVAKFISDVYPSHALLRCHPSPNQRLMKELMDIADELRVTLDLSTAGAIQTGLEQLYAACKDTDVADAITNMATRPMQPAEYFCTGAAERERWAHYALAVRCYTHFTSPIRRYPDIIVHRLLHAALTSGEEFRQKLDRGATHKMQVLAMACNIGKLQARNVQDASSDLFLKTWLEKEPVETVGVVASVKGAKFFDIYVPQLALPYRIQCEQIAKNISPKFDPATSVLTLNLKCSTNGSSEERRAQVSADSGNASRKRIPRLVEAIKEHHRRAVRVVFQYPSAQSVAVILQTAETKDPIVHGHSDPVHVEFQYLKSGGLSVALHIREPPRNHLFPECIQQKSRRNGGEIRQSKADGLQFPFELARFSKIPVKVWAQRDHRLGVVKDIKVDLVLAHL